MLARCISAGDLALSSFWFYSLRLFGLMPWVLFGHTKKDTHHSTVLQCRQRDSEIAALRTSLAERDSKVQASRSELAELQLQVKSHEHSLQHAYNQLAEASRDKARVRQQLLENQAELTGVSLCCTHTHVATRC